MHSTTKRVAVALAAAALPLSLATAANPAAAIPPHAEEIAPLLAVFPDFDNRLVAYLNTTREGFCAWEAAGFVGDPPLLKELSPAWERTTGTGEVGGVARDELHLELWPMDVDAEGASSCEDTSDATGPFATGDADVRASDRSLYGTDDGRGAYVADMKFHAVLTGSDGGRYGYHLHVKEVFDGKGRVRHLDSAHIRLTTLS
jgi:hypothetical protein